MSIIDPRTGKPATGPNPNTPPNPMEAIIAAINLLNKRDEAMGQQLIHLGIFVEYIVKQLEEKSLVSLDGFEQFAQTKWDEIAKSAGAKQPAVNLDE